MSNIRPIICGNSVGGITRSVIDSAGGSLLDLDFATMSPEALRDVLTNVTASTAMVWNSAGVLVWSDHNLVTDSSAQESGWAAIRGAKGAAALEGGQQTQIFVEDDTETSTHLIEAFFAAVSGETYNFSFLIEAADRDFVYFTTNAASTSRSYFNIAAGTLGTKGGTHDSCSITEISAGLYRCEIVVTATSTGSKTFDVGAAAVDNSHTYSGADLPAFKIHAARVQRGPDHSGWLEAVGGAYYAPMWLCDPDGTNRRLYAPPPFTNLVTASQDMDDAGYTHQSGISTLDGNLAGPDGLLSMSRFTSDGTTGGRTVWTGSSITTAGTYTFSVVTKDGTVGTGADCIDSASDFTVVVASTRNVDLGDGFTLRSKTFTVSSTGTYFQPIFYACSDGSGTISASAYAYAGWPSLTTLHDDSGVFVPTFGAAAAIAATDYRLASPVGAIMGFVIKGLNYEYTQDTYRSAILFSNDGNNYINYYREQFQKMSHRYRAGGSDELYTSMNSVGTTDDVNMGFGARFSDGDYQVTLRGSSNYNSAARTYLPFSENTLIKLMSEGGLEGVSMKSLTLYSEAPTDRFLLEETA